jgi:excisionase family DNA binding protein
MGAELHREEKIVEKTASSTRFVSLTDLAEELGATSSTVRRWLTEGGVSSYQLGGAGGVVRYRRDEVEEWLTRSGDSDSDSESDEFEDDEDDDLGDGDELEDDDESDDEDEFEDDDELEDADDV